MAKEVRRQETGGICMQGSDTMDSMPEDLRQGIINYYGGKGMPLKVAEKYYGLRGSLVISPSPKDLQSRTLC